MAPLYKFSCEYFEIFEHSFFMDCFCLIDFYPGSVHFYFD